VSEHHRHSPPTLTANILEEKKAYLGRRSLIDFSLMGGALPSNQGEIAGMWANGAVSFKGFTCEIHGQEPLLEGDLYELFTQLAKIDGMCLLHCEQDALLKWNERKLKQLGRQDPMVIAEWRSPLAEVLAVRNVAYLAEVTGCKVVIAHVSQPEVLREIAAARGRGARIFAETCVQYLHLTTEDLKRQGGFLKFTPPPRDPATVEGMWEMVRQGYVQLISSDHCPFPHDQKGGEDIWDVPFGIPGVETTLRLMLTAVNAGKLPLTKIPELMSEGPARLYNLYPQKGNLEPGADADMVLVDMNRREVLSSDGILSRAGWTPYEGWEITGGPVMTIARGKVLVTEGQVHEETGWGNFITRTNW
jgi:dihydroorotase-like cyclic amidohydrolase